MFVFNVELVELLPGSRKDEKGNGMGRFGTTLVVEELLFFFFLSLVKMRYLYNDQMRFSDFCE
jgi:hypothetical protein